MNIYFFILRIVFLVSWSNFLYSNIDDYFSNPVSPSASNYGNTGILELPNARFMPSGSLRFNFSGSFPYEHTSLTATPFSWFETT